MTLFLLEARYSICRLDAEATVPPWATKGAFFSVTRTAGELSVVCETADVPDRVQADHGWRALAVKGPLALNAVGILAELSGPLAAAGVSVFAVSTYDTDYLIVRELDVDRSAAALFAAGHTVNPWAPPEC